MQISNSPKFKEEYDKISRFIESSTDDKIKTQMITLQRELVSYVKKMDMIHSELIFTNRLSEDNSSLRTKITEVRKKIFKIIEKSR